uniref:Uncharacterized protein n=1 Tax=Taeniopygia guttata TaxID=59729 RepID=A0A674H9N5_TAEGU
MSSELCRTQEPCEGGDTALSPHIPLFVQGHASLPWSGWHSPSERKGGAGVGGPWDSTEELFQQRKGINTFINQLPGNPTASSRYLDSIT